MTKETARPKAINIIRPTKSFPLYKTAPSSKEHNEPADHYPAPSVDSSTDGSRKLRVSASAKIAVNDRPSFVLVQRSDIRRIDHQISRSTTTSTFELYKPSAKLQTKKPAMTRSLTNSMVSSKGPANPAAKQLRPHTDRHASESSGTLMPPRSITYSQGLDELADKDTPFQERGSNESDFELDPEDSEQKHTDQHEDGPAIKEARVNRKIADLEISNRSLLAINKMLEMTVRKQASQVMQLKRQLLQDGERYLSPCLLEEEQQDDGDGWEKDEVFCRIWHITESLIAQGRASLQSEYKSFGRVLSHYPTDEEVL